MTIISRYLFRELLPPFFLSVAALGFLLVTQQALRLIDLLVNRGVDATVLLRIFGALLPAFFVITLPIAALMATIGAFNRLASDREILALRAAGCASRRFVQPAAWFCAALSAAAYGLALIGEPWSGQSLRTLTRDLLARQVTLAVVEGQFNEGLSNMSIYVERVPAPNELQGVLIIDERSPDAEWLILADHGEFLGGGSTQAVGLRLYQGSLYGQSTDADTDRYHRADFETYELKLDPSRFRLSSPPSETDQTVSSLRTRAAAEQAEHGSTSRATSQALYAAYKDLAFPLSTFWLGIIGVPLGLSTGHTGRTSGFAFGILTTGLYYLVMIGADTVASREWLPPLGAAILPNACLILVALLLVWRMDRVRVFGR